MSNTSNTTDQTTVPALLSADYNPQNNKPNVTVINENSSIIERMYLANYVSAIRKNNAESVTFLINVGTNQKSEEIRKLNTILENKPIMTFVSSEP